MVINMNKNNQFLGVAFLIMSALGFAIMSIFVKLSGDLPTIQKVFFRNFMTVIFSIALVIYYGGSFYGHKKNRKALLLRSTFGTIGMICYFYAMDNMLLSDANMINKLSTFFLLLFSAIFLKEKLKPYQIIAVVLAFIGTLFIIKPAFEVEIIPYIISLLAAILAGAAYTVLRHLRNKEQYYTITLFFSTFSVVTLLPLVIYFYEPMVLKQVIYLILAGFFASIGQFGITIAYRYAPAKEISIFNYFNVIFVTILSYLVFLDFPDIYSIIGYLIIFSASTFMFLYSKHQQN
jgi:drug/metabolite transporter (DMT)-like permease